MIFRIYHFSFYSWLQFFSSLLFASKNEEIYLRERFSTDIGPVPLICINLKSTIRPIFHDKPRNYNAFTRHLRNQNNSLESTLLLSLSATLFKITTRYGATLPAFQRIYFRTPLFRSRVTFPVHDRLPPHCHRRYANRP